MELLTYCSSINGAATVLTPSGFSRFHWVKLSEASATVFPSAAKNSGIWLSKMVPNSSPIFSFPCSSQPFKYRRNADSVLSFTFFAAPRNPRTPVWCVPQEDGHPEIWIFGSTSAGRSASRTAFTHACKVPGNPARRPGIPMHRCSLRMPQTRSWQYYPL